MQDFEKTIEKEIQMILDNIPEEEHFDLLYWTYLEQADKDVDLAIELIKADIVLHELEEEYEICHRLKNILEKIE